MKVINEFKGKYAFLSNFYNSPVTYQGLTYLNSEAAFQAQKTNDEMIRKQFTELPPNKAKALGRKVILRSDWEEIKDKVMYEIVWNKFATNKEIRVSLINTNESYLEEGNAWNDIYWGVNLLTGEGQNKLGLILMKIREQIKQYENDMS